MGDDGHAKVESVCDPCCNDSEPACFLDELEANHDHHDDCVNCTDLPLFQEVLKRRVLHPVVIEASPDIEFISSTINSCGERFLSEISRLSVSAFPPCAPDLKLGTTVLLC